MQIHVFAKGDKLTYIKGDKFAGQRPPYVGRRTVVSDGEIRHVATAEGHTFDSRSKQAERLRKLMHRGEDCVWPADAETAQYLGVPFVPVEQGSDGEFRPAPKKISSKRSDS